MQVLIFKIKSFSKYIIDVLLHFYVHISDYSILRGIRVGLFSLTVAFARQEKCVRNDSI